MPNRRFDWHEHIKDVEKEYKAVRLAVDRLAAWLAASPEVIVDDETRAYLRNADANLEGTYIVRLFGAFEAALRSYDRARHNDPTRDQVASVLIDATGGRRGQGISATVRQAAHDVRLVRNFWAHESDETPPPMSIVDARHQLQVFLSWLPDEWA